MATQVRLLRSARWQPVQHAPASLVTSVRVWLGLLAFLAIVELFIKLVGAGLEQDPRSVLFSWPSLAIFGSAGLLGVWLADRTGFPAAWDKHAGRERWLYPLALGAGFGLGESALDKLTNGIPFFLQQTGIERFNAPLPGALLFYPGGAILVEVIYRLLPIPVLLWLGSNVLLRGHARRELFWILAVLSSALEPLSQDLEALRAGAMVIFVSQFGFDYALNFAQAVTFRRAGFLASILMRVGMYLVWHIAYGNVICNC